jgi:hypothetical protein
MSTARFGLGLASTLQLSSKKTDGDSDATSYCKGAYCKKENTKISTGKSTQNV